jgi:hypothetical protein
MSADMAGGRRGEDREAREGDFHACKKPVTCCRRKAASGTIKVIIYHFKIKNSHFFDRAYEHG